MYRRLSVSAGALALSLCLAHHSSAEDAVTFKLKWQSAKCYVQSLTMSQEQTISMPMLPEPMKQKTTQAQEIATSVMKSLEDGGQELQMEFRKLKMAIETPMGTMSFDSEKDTGQGTDPISSMMRKFVDAKIKYVIDSAGQVKEVQGLDEMMKGMSASSNSPFGKMFSKESLEQMCSQSFVEGLPEKPVKIGDTWTTKTKMPMGDMVTMNVEMKYTFKGWETLDKHRCALLESVGTIKGEARKGENPMGMKMSIKGGDASGKIWFDLELGMPRKSVVNHKMKMEMSMMPPGATQPVTSTIDQVQKTSIILTKIGDVEKKEDKKE
jgi:hypothetical protein